jgi:hypothetical protein
LKHVGDTRIVTSLGESLGDPFIALEASPTTSHVLVEALSKCSTFDYGYLYKCESKIFIIYPACGNKFVTVSVWGKFVP